MNNMTMNKKLLTTNGCHAAFAKKCSFGYDSQCDIATCASGHFVRVSTDISPVTGQLFAYNAIGLLTVSKI